jgi:NADPH:quinone reductase-like Zn-dependent oxidoreductase
VRIEAREKLTAHVRGAVHGPRIWHLEREMFVLTPGGTRILRLAADSAHSQAEISAALRRGKELRAHITVRLGDALGHSKRWRRFVRFSSCRQRGPDVRTQEPMDPEQFRDDFRVLIELLREEKIHPVPSERLPLSEARHAHELLEPTASKGKLVLVP